MPYKIAVASLDGVRIDETFGSADRFIIYEVADGVYQKTEERSFDRKDTDQRIPDICPSSGGCATGNGCGESGKGCNVGKSEMSTKVELIADCRCVVCKKIGFHIQKQLERKAISTFDVDCSVDEALGKITNYFTRVDRHESLRVWREE